MKSRAQTPSPLVVEAIKLFNTGQLGPAAESARRALAIKPSDADAIGLLGVIEARAGRFEIGLGYLRKAVDLRPASPDAHFNLACALQQSGDGAGAERSFREAIRLNPAAAGYHLNLGTLYFARRDYVLARESFERAVKRDPSSEIALINLYAVYRVLGAMDAIERLTQTAIARWPQNSTHWIHRAEALFFLGQLREAWDCYGWRFKSTQAPVISRAVSGLAMWRGEDVADKSVLVFTEQGPGDEVMYGTMLADLRAKVGKLSLLCSQRMAPLFRRTFPDVTVYGDTVPDEALSAINLQAPLVAFAKVLRPDLAAFGAGAARLNPDAAKVAELRAAYRGDSNKLLVGIAWRSSGVQDAGQKSVNLGVWGSLFALPNVQFVNLQYGDCARELAAVQSEYGATILHDPTVDALGDLDRYAAQVAAMDVVVSSSNTAAHFAGALGVPTFCMIPATAGLGRRWYWFEKDGHSAWYGTLKLRAQSKAGSWTEPARDVTMDLARMLSARGQAQDVASFLMRLVAAYRQGGQPENAMAVLQALSTMPGQEAAAFFEMGRLAKDQGQLDDAFGYFSRVTEYDPQAAAALNMAGVVLVARHKYAEAEPLYRRAIAVAPEAPEAYNNLGTAIRRMGRGVEADAFYKKANELKPDHPDILLNLAANLTETDRPAEAIPYFDQLLRLHPDHAAAHHGRSFALLTSGQFTAGWPELWWRNLVDKNDERPPEDRPPRWAGQSLSGKTLLIWTEHGLGDEILTTSMVPDAAAVASSVTLVCSPRMVALFRRTFPMVTVCDRTALTTLPLDRFDFQLSISELGAAFRTSPQSFPDRLSFLKADTALRDKLKRRYNPSAKSIVLGVSWASANPELGFMKSLGLAQIIASIAGADPASAPLVFVNLQYGDHAAEITAAERETGVSLISDRSVDPMRDMDAFAAQVAAMDAVVTISNTTAHVAGALGIPTLLLLPYNRGRHWYWLRAFSQCLWYPSVRYCVQNSDGTWTDALRSCRDAIATLPQGGGRIAFASAHVT